MCSRNARWNETFPRTPSYRQVTPPQPVSINLDQALARDNPPLRTRTPSVSPLAVSNSLRASLRWVWSRAAVAGGYSAGGRLFAR